MLAIALVSRLAWAASGDVEVHGYGSWCYSRSGSDDNLYHESSEAGDGGYHNLAVTLASQVSGNVRISTQVWWEESAGEEGTATIDYAFGEWCVADALKLRMGQIKHPFGIYTEIYDVGTLRPFFWLPEGVYGPAGIVAESYRGIGLTGTAFKRGYQLDYDVYAGETDLEFTEIPVFGGDEAEVGEDADEIALRDITGMRLVVGMPGVDLRLGLSAYTGREDGADGERRSCAGALADWSAGDWAARGEAVVVEQADAADVDAAYLEVSRVVHGGWQVAARVDHSRTRFDGSLEPAAESMLRHRELTAGLNYWFAPEFVAKLSVSRIDGNRFARPGDAEAVLDGGELVQRTNLVSLGVQFAF